MRLYDYWGEKHHLGREDKAAWTARLCTIIKSIFGVAK